MPLPIQVLFKDIDHSDAVEQRIRQNAEKLAQFFPKIKHCRVVVETQHHQHHGNLYNIKIDISVPQKEIIVNQSQHDNQAHEDIYVAIRDSFNAAKRQLEDYVRKLRGETKSHNPTSRGSRGKRNINFEE